MNWTAFALGLLPEHFLLLGIVLLLIQAIVTDRGQGSALIALLTVGAGALAGLWLGASDYAAAPFVGQLSVTPGSSMGKAIALGLALPLLLMIREELGDGGAVYPLLVSSLYGLALMLSSDSFLTLFLGLEVMSLPVYVLTLMGMRRASSPEAALKYLVLGGAATATFLMGVSLLYGFSGTMAIGGFGQALASARPLAVVGAAMLLLAFFLKAAVVPFHSWAPDAYEGASVPITGYMAAVIKAGVLLAALHLFGQHKLSPSMVGLLAALPLLSIVWGNLVAMRQKNLRRMMAYSSIAHAGYLYYAFLGEGPGRLQSVLFYLLVYGLLTVLVFAVLPAHRQDDQRDRLDQLKGLFHRQPFAAVMIGLAMLSLAGIPPLPGFVAKFLIFKEVMAAGHTLPAVLGLVGSYLGIYFYLRVIQLMFMSAGPGFASDEPPLRKTSIAAALMCLLPALAIGLGPGWFIARI